MGTQSELALENEVLQHLVNLGHERVHIKNHDQLVENFRSILNERHYDKLDGRPLSDSEFERILMDIKGKSVFDSATILRDQYVLKRDDESTVYLRFLNPTKWCQNRFQVTNQINANDTYRSRYDVTLLINGLPLVQIELKKSGVAITEAFNQIERYRRDNFTGLFQFLQLFIVSNKMETRYFANSDQKILKGQMFYWSDEKNERINHLKDFIDTFLEPCHIAKMITRYMVVNQTDQALMVLRPYQVHAVEALLKRALETNNNGYIWHTTGSGKTLTSFKASQILSKEESIKKVIFLVDRKDLDNQTLAEFNKFQADSVDLTNNTNKLLKQLGDPSLPIIVTTIQKMSKAVQSEHPVMDNYRKDKVVFIIDECHRSQFGEMHLDIRRHFKNAQYFGFTGTPRFEENQSEDGRATADIFDKCLHHYLIKDAIRDGNVLGFSVEYINTLKDKLLEDDTLVKQINTQEAWQAQERIDMIVDHIIENYHKKTHNGTYTSLFTVQSIPMAIQYYEAFKKAKSQGKHNLNIATIFSFTDNEDSNGNEAFVPTRQVLDGVMQDYNALFDTNYSTDNFEGYFSDVSKRMKQVKPGEKIDILIVVNIFLTGFDSKKLNTLYVDKHLEYHSLIQAYSRTNRVEKSTKPYGNIVCYRDLKEETDEAIRIFSQTNNTDTVLSASYDEYQTHFKSLLDDLLTIAQTPGEVDKLEREDDQKRFIEVYRDLANTLLKLKTFEDFEFTEAKLGISEQTFEDYKSKYLNLYDQVIRREKNNEEGSSILDDIDFKIDILRNDLINVQYIMNLIREIDLSDKQARDKKRQQIHQLLDKADDDQLRLKADLIRAFLDEVVPTLREDTDLDEAYELFENQSKNQEIVDFSENKNYPSPLLNDLINEYEFSGHIDKQQVDQGIQGGLLTLSKKSRQVIQFVQSIAQKYSQVED